jgi:hypothetical protein
VGLIAVRYEQSDPPQLDFKIVLAGQALGDQLRHQQAQVIAEVLQWLMTNHPSSNHGAAIGWRVRVRKPGIAGDLRRDVRPA